MKKRSLWKKIKGVELPDISLKLFLFAIVINVTITMFLFSYFSALSPTVEKGIFDLDGDGYNSDQGRRGDDCNDTNPNISPNATEICDDIDNDCDGLIDEGTCLCELGETQVCGSDVGACELGVETCDAFGNWGDCLGGIFSKDEVCGNGIDEDCDGSDLSCYGGSSGGSGGGGGGDDGGGDDPGESLSIVSDSLDDGYSDVDYEVTLEATGGTSPYSWSILNSLPSGLTLNISTGKISGKLQSAGLFNLSIRVEDSPGDYFEKNLSLNVLSTESEEGSPFIPDSYVPISLFIESSPDYEAIILPVKQEILDFISTNGLDLMVACSDANGLEYFDESAISDGVVIYETIESKNCTVVGGSTEGFFENDYPIVTHWDSSLNGGRGGFGLGASGTAGIAMNLNSSSPYWIIEDYALFSDNPYLSPPVPAFERYTYENFAGSQLTDMEAITDSNEVLNSTGYPVIFKNYPWAFDPEAPMEKQIQEEIPAFQVAYAYLIEPEPGKASLAAYILPPEWTSNPSKLYPMLFNGYYGVRGSYVGYGVDFMKIIGELYNEESGSAIGVVWSGGGIHGTLVHQRSIYDNLALVFSTAGSLLGADQENIVAIGSSRGAMIGLVAASNPYYDNYKVKFISAFSPGVKLGTHVFDYINLAYPALQGNIAKATGYKYSWMIGWEDPVAGLSGQELYLQNTLGTTNREEADELSVIADDFVQRLVDSETKVLYTAGSHDYFMPFNLGIEYIDKLREYGVPVRFRINYRFGHGGASHDNNLDIKNALRSILTNTTIELEEGTFHYRRVSEEDYSQSVQFDPEFQPIIFEATKMAVWGQNISFVYAGGQNDIIEVKVYKINDAQWAPGRNVVIESEEPFFHQYVELGSTNSIETAANHLVIPLDGSVSTGYYIYDVRFSRDGGANFIQLPAEFIPQPSETKQPVFQMLSEEPRISGDQLLILGEEGRGWGLSSEMLDEGVNN